MIQMLGDVHECTHGFLCHICGSHLLIYFSFQYRTVLSNVTYNISTHCQLTVHSYFIKVDDILVFFIIINHGTNQVLRGTVRKRNYCFLIRIFLNFRLYRKLNHLFLSFPIQNSLPLIIIKRRRRFYLGIFSKNVSKTKTEERLTLSQFF